MRDKKNSGFNVWRISEEVKDHVDLQLSHYPPQGIIESFTAFVFLFNVK